MTIRIAVINHKGGVGKTTLVYHLALVLAERGFSVLCVDADPQCNLTTLAIGERGLDSLLDKAPSASRTLWSALQNRERRIEPIEVTATDAVSVALLPGDVRIFEHEEQLALAWANYRDASSASLEVMTRLGRRVERIEDQSKADFVLFDTAPSLGALNRQVALESDFLVVPVGIDLFSARGLKTLGRALVMWMEQWSAITRFAPASLLTRPGEPILAGYVLQRAPSRPTRAQGQAIAHIQSAVRSDLKTVISHYDRRLARGRESDFRLGAIPDIPSLPSTQGTCHPIWDNHPESKKPFSDVADRLLARIRMMR